MINILYILQGLRFNKAHVTHPELKATFHLPIIGVKKNPTSPMYTSLGVITKGTVIEVGQKNLLPYFLCVIARSINYRIFVLKCRFFFWFVSILHNLKIRLYTKSCFYIGKMCPYRKYFNSHFEFCWFNDVKTC